MDYALRGINGPLKQLLFAITHGSLHFPGLDVLPTFAVYSAAAMTLDDVSYMNRHGVCGSEAYSTIPRYLFGPKTAGTIPTVMCGPVPSLLGRQPSRHISRVERRSVRRQLEKQHAPDSGKGPNAELFKTKASMSPNTNFVDPLRPS